MKTVRVMIVDPLVEVIDRLEQILSEDKRIEVVARATTAAECLHKAGVAQPHVMLMDLKFDDMHATRLIRELSRKSIAVAVLIVSPQAIKDSPLLDGALVVGAFDYILRSREIDRLEKIGPQILNRIFVASFSKTKQIPTGDIPEEEEAAPGTDGAAAPRAPDIVLVDVPEERARDLLVLLTSIQPEVKPAVLLVIRRPPPFGELLVQKIKDRVQFSLQTCREGDYIMPKKVYVLDALDHDLILERNISGEWVQLSRGSPRESTVPAPGIDRLLDSLAHTYNDRGAAALLGGSPQVVSAGLEAVKSHGGTVIIEESASELIEGLAALGRSELNDRVLSVAQIAALINGDPA